MVQLLYHILRMEDNCLLPSRSCILVGKTGEDITIQSSICHGRGKHRRLGSTWVGTEPRLGGQGRGSGWGRGASGGVTASSRVAGGQELPMGLGRGRGREFQSEGLLKGLSQRRLLIRFTLEKTHSDYSLKNESEA